jgi:hypothetical protein
MKEVTMSILALAAFAAPDAMMAQDGVEATVSADVVSSYIWRGQDMGGAAVQPTLGIGYKGLSLTAWGSYGIDSQNEMKELDLTLSYSIGGLTVGVTDYYCATGIESTPGKYFEYAAHSTAHVFEANVGYDFGCLSVNWFTNFAGADGVNKDGERAYSSYFELAAPFKLGGIDWTATLGAVPYATTSYADAGGFAVTNVGVKATKELVVTPSFKLPVFAGLSANPSTEKLYFVAGFTLGL